MEAAWPSDMVLGGWMSPGTPSNPRQMEISGGRRSGSGGSRSHSHWPNRARNGSGDEFCELHSGGTRAPAAPAAARAAGGTAAGSPFAAMQLQALTQARLYANMAANLIRSPPMGAIQVKLTFYPGFVGPRVLYDTQAGTKSYNQNRYIHYLSKLCRLPAGIGAGPKGHRDGGHRPGRRHLHLRHVIVCGPHRARILVV